jgi:uridine kinase
VALASVFSGLYVLSTLLQTPLRASMAQEWDARAFMQLSDPAAAHVSALLMTAMTAVGVILAIRIWRQAISRNDYFRLSRKPFVVGIAGDSGAGKDTYADSLQGLFGKHSVTHLSGDDYHLWDRQKPMWQVMTHLNPMANDLEGFCNDLIALTDGQTIQSRHYDHQTGKKSRPHSIDSNDFIIASGLHALYLPILRECYTLKVYLDIDEALRKHFKFQRDVLQRGHSIDRVQQSLYRRAPDAERFIHPQRQYADLVLSLQPINPGALDAMRQDQALRLKLVARTRHGLNEPSLARVLVGVCGLHVDMEVSDDNSEVILTIEGECSDQDIALAAQILCPRVFEFLDTQPQWQGGVLGLMQLITLSHINQALTKRIF